MHIKDTRLTKRGGARLGGQRRVGLCELKTSVSQGDMVRPLLYTELKLAAAVHTYNLSPGGPESVLGIAGQPVWPSW